MAVRARGKTESDFATQRLAQMRARAQQARLVVRNHINRDAGNIVSEAAFIFKRRTETRRLKELQEAWHDAAGNIDTTKGAEIQRQVAAETAMMTQNIDSARRQSVQLSSSARWLTSFGFRFSGTRLSTLTIAR